LSPCPPVPRPPPPLSKKKSKKIPSKTPFTLKKSVALAHWFKNHLVNPKYIKIMTQKSAIMNIIFPLFHSGHTFAHRRCYLILRLPPRRGKPPDAA